MTNEQAEEWAGLGRVGEEPMTAEELAEHMFGVVGVVDTPLEVLFSSMLCAVCLEHWDEALPECPGMATEDRNQHVWQAFFTAPATDADAAAWADPEGEYSSGRPESIAVICVLCGESPGDTPPECRERTFWTEESALEVDPTDFLDGG